MGRATLRRESSPGSTARARCAHSAPVFLTLPRRSPSSQRLQQNRLVHRASSLVRLESFVMAGRLHGGCPGLHRAAAGHRPLPVLDCSPPSTSASSRWLRGAPRPRSPRCRQRSGSRPLFSKKTSHPPQGCFDFCALLPPSTVARK